MAALTRTRSRVIEWGAMLAAIALLASVLAFLWEFLFHSGRTAPLIDIQYYRDALAAVAAGEPLFDVLGYPPFALVVITPLGWLPQLQAEQLWTAGAMVGAMLLAAIVVRLARHVPGRTPSLPGPVGAVTSAALAASILLGSYPMVGQLVTGQISLLVVGLAFIDGCGMLPRRLRGSLIGLTGAIKLTPLIFVPYYLVTGQRRPAVTAGLSFALFTGVGFLLYPSDSLRFWTHLGSTTRFGELSRADNLSMLGALSRWIADPSIARYCWYALALVVGVAALARARAHFRRGEGVPAALVVGAASVAISPVSWPHHQIWLVLVGIWLLWTPRLRDRLLGIAVLMLYLPGPDLLLGGALAPTKELFALVPVVVSVLGLPRERGGPGQPGGEAPAVTADSGVDHTSPDAA